MTKLPIWSANNFWPLFQYLADIFEQLSLLNEQLRRKNKTLGEIYWIICERRLQQKIWKVSMA